MQAKPFTPMTLRKAEAADLDFINRIVERAVMSWDLPERVKRLAMTSYHYREDDLAMSMLVVGENTHREIVGLAAWEQADPLDSPSGKRTLQLHGIYVDPDYKLRGVGSRLLQAAEQAAVDGLYDCLMVKAQPDAAGFFITQGMRPFETEDSRPGYAHRYLKDVSTSPQVTVPGE